MSGLTKHLLHMPDFQVERQKCPNISGKGTCNESFNLSKERIYNSRRKAKLNYLTLKTHLRESLTEG